MSKRVLWISSRTESKACALAAKRNKPPSSADFKKISNKFGSKFKQEFVWNSLSIRLYGSCLEIVQNAMAQWGRYALADDILSAKILMKSEAKIIHHCPSSRSSTLEANQSNWNWIMIFVVHLPDDNVSKTRAYVRSPRRLNSWLWRICRNFDRTERHFCLMNRFEPAGNELMIHDNPHRRHQIFHVDYEILAGNILWLWSGMACSPCRRENVDIRPGRLVGCRVQSVADGDLLVEEVIIYFDFRICPEIVRQQHHWNIDMAELVYLEGDSKSLAIISNAIQSLRIYRVIDAPHEYTQYRLIGSK